jgi:hypothetical protein
MHLEPEMLEILIIDDRTIAIQSIIDIEEVSTIYNGHRYDAR